MMKWGVFLLLFFLVSPVWGKPKSASPKWVRVLWDAQLPAGKKNKFFPETAAPLISNGRIFVGTGRGVMTALDQKGKTLWSFDSKGPIGAKAATDGNRIFFGNSRGMAFALELETGQKLWEAFVGGEILSEAALSDSAVFFVTTSREIYSLDKKSGRENWSTYIRGYEKKITRRGNSPLRVDGGRLFAAFADGQVVSLSASGGGIGWTEHLADPDRVFKDIDAGLLMDGSDLYAVGYFGEAARLKKATGSVVWKKGGASGVTPAMDSSKIFVAVEDGSLMALDKGTGLRLWETALGGGLLSSPLVHGNFLFVGTETKGGFVLDKGSGRILQKISLAGSFIGHAEKGDSTVYLLTSGGKLTALALNPAHPEDPAP